MEKRTEKYGIPFYDKLPADWQAIPVLSNTDVVIPGGTLRDIQKAGELAGQGKSVLLALPQSCLVPEAADTFCFDLTPEMRRFFPERTGRGNLLLPEEGKKYAEDFCTANHIDLLYGVYLLDCCSHEGKLCLRLGAKGGVFAVLCRELIPSAGAGTGAGTDRISYGVLTQECGAFQVLRIFEKPIPGEDTDSAPFLQRMQEKAMEAFLEKKRERQDLILGRFAPRVSREAADSCREDKDCQSALSREEDPVREICVFTGNEFLKWGRYPLLGKAEHPVRGTCVRAKRECWDVVVAGGGTAGAMAALYAARGGLKTVLVEPEYVLGGTATAGGVSTYWFGNRFRDVEEIDKETDRLMRRFSVPRREGIWDGRDDFHPSLRAFVLQKLCLEAGVEIRYGQLCFGAVCEEEAGIPARIRGVAAAGERGITAYLGDFVIDATGDADIAVFCGARTVYGSERDCVTYWASLAQYVDVRAYKNNFSTMVVCADPVDRTRFIRRARKLGDHLFDHGRYLSMRESRHLVSKTVVDLKDLMGFRTWEDGLYTCYSNYDPKGKLSADLVYCGVLPPQAQIQIPLSALLPFREDGERIQGLYVAGKAISATHNVFPSIRMQPDLMHQGAVLGGLLAHCHREGIVPEKMDPAKRKSFVRGLTGDPLTLPEGCFSHREDPAFLREAVERLEEKSRTHWVDVPFTYTEAGQPEILTVMLAKREEVIPLLTKRLQRDTGAYDWRKTLAAGGEVLPLRILLIGCCLWHGETSLEEEYADYVMESLSGDFLPKREASVMCAQLLPDHGVMPETVYQMNLLGRSGSPFAKPVFARALPLLREKERDYRDIRSGIFHYIESFALAASCGKDPVWAKWLGELLDFEEIALAGEDSGEDLIKQRLLILKLILSEALAGQGDQRGIERLFELAKNPCAAVSISARMALERTQKGRENGEEKALHDRKFTY